MIIIMFMLSKEKILHVLIYVIASFCKSIFNITSYSPNIKYAYHNDYSLVC